MDTPLKKCLIITGMHRSNTSYIAKAFDHAGLFLGYDLIPADDHNKDGHYEDQDFVEYHQHLINKYNLSSLISDISYKKCEALSLDNDDRVLALNLIQQRWNDHNIFGWKDPRTCHFLRLWKSLIPQAKFIFIIRNPHESVASLIRRRKVKAEFIFRPDLWYRYHNFWQVSNKQILEFYKDFSSDCHLVFTPQDIFDAEASHRLNQVMKTHWNFSIDAIDLGKDYRSELVTQSADAQHYKQNKNSLKIYNQLLELVESSSF